MIETDTAGFYTRDGTTDANQVFNLANDEYRLASRDLMGWAIDIGAHIGTVALSLARAHAGLRVLAVEAVPENSDLLERNIERFGLGDRVTSVRAWAARPGDLTGTVHYGYRHREEETDGYVAAHRFVGNTYVSLGDPEFSVELPAVSLDSLMETFGIEDVALVKIDCEGCEWAFLDTPAVAKVQTIVGEFHGGYPGQDGFQPAPRARIAQMLSLTHRIEFWSDEPTIGLFEATRR